MTFLLLLIAVIAVGVVATPGLAAAALLIIPLGVLAVIWWVGLAAATRGHPAERLIRVRPNELLGPGRPDDPFAPGARPMDRGVSEPSPPCSRLVPRDDREPAP